MKAYIWFVPSFCVFLGILLLSTAFSDPFQIDGLGHIDKIKHAFAYFVLITSLLFGFEKSNLLRRSVWLWLVFGCMGYGVSLEFVQYAFFPNRYFEWLDAGANVLGTVLGAIVFNLIRNGKNV